jgi:hypothetical protein
MRMVAGDVSPGPDGFERRSFECLKCGHRDSQMVPIDPMKSDAVGWLEGELGHRASEHEIIDGRMVPKKQRRCNEKDERQNHIVRAYKL